MTTNASISTQTNELRAHAPGKLILSGEHSVLYGAPAVAMAVAQYTEVWYRSVSIGEGLKTAFENLSSEENYPLKLLSKLKSILDHRFDLYMRGELEVQKILTRPDDLAVYTVAALLHDNPANTHPKITEKPEVGRLRLLAPGQLGSRSQLPIGAGLGSSAAVVAATTVLCESLLNRPKTLDERFERVRFCERLKHGKSGPVDAAAVVRGGLVEVGPTGVGEPKIAQDHDLLNGQGWYWVLHGKPESSTGECVSQVRKNHEKDIALWDDFAACTNDFLDALANNSDPDDIITQNQKLLRHIGVVPQETSDFIAKLTDTGAAAKTCGAGSVRGDKGGVILVHQPDPHAMKSTMEAHPELPWAPLRLAQSGAALGPAPTFEIDGAAK